MLYSRAAFACRIALILGALLPAGAWAATGAPASDAGQLLRLIGGLALVVMLIIGLSWSLRRMGGLNSTASGQLKALASMSVGHRERVVLMQVGKQQLLLGVAPGRVQTLHVLEEPIAVEPRSAGDAQATPFAERLRRVMQERR